MPDPVSSTSTATTSTPGEQIQVKTTSTIKPGWKSTEFALACLAKLVGFLMTSGVVGDGSPIMRIAGVAAMVLTSLGYTVARSVVKSSAVVLVLLVVAPHLIACTPTQRASTITSTVLTADAGCNAFAAYREAQQEKLVAASTSGADATSKTLAFQASTSKLKLACDGLYKAGIAASAANDNDSVAALGIAAQLVTATLKASAIVGQ